mmetsp:Transcript_19359/g.21535  ORF Transcript_19359/g.21535 Transcript_19359/m.21535 type:complete len:185 (+) Transcript_19359:69-623(+)
MQSLYKRLEQSRSSWEYRGQKRPPFAVEPKPGQESVFDYPRPPRATVDKRKVRVVLNKATIASTTNAVRVCETAGPPTFYIPPSDIDQKYLQKVDGNSICEWKGVATYWNVSVGDTQRTKCAWSYDEPFPGFEQIAGFISFYPAHFECYIDDERVRPQPGGFYGGWVTDEIVGPFKGAEGVPAL